jgi:hypothetical protein
MIDYDGLHWNTLLVNIVKLSMIMSLADGLMTSICSLQPPLHSRLRAAGTNES